ncbi:hypothetical protein HHI36_020474 [Cryptolaemus montrouzieri]|uniref:RNA helicase n=1 Tax=Cryptolaemus montrouzieri TaxID=559131 RepID=A0ABD2NC09_9CUCU
MWFRFDCSIEVRNRKTLVFSVVALEMVDPKVSDLQVLILAPTREIAVQISDVIHRIGQNIESLKVSSFIGGLPEKDDFEKAQNCHIAVGAPGRVKSLIKKNILKVDALKLFVLDEADKLLEKNFQNDINEIYYTLPVRKQMIAASATFSKELKEFLPNYMQSPTEVNAEVETPLLLGLKHFIKEVKHSSNVVQEMKNKNEELVKLLTKISFTQCLVFSNYQSRAETVSVTINRHGFHSAFISAAQTQQKRLETINSLKNFKCRILLSTDLTARGIDAANVDLIINYDVPIDVMTYLHRMGRAGRYGSRGICISLVSGNKDLRQIQKFLGYIGGTNLTISKIDDIACHDTDLWECDQMKFEQVSGIIEDDNNEHSVSESIKNELLELNSVQKKGKCKSQGKKSKECKTSSADINDVIRDEYVVYDENTLQELSSLEINETKTDPSSNIKAADISKTIEDVQGTLESMAKGLFNFENPTDSKSSTLTKPDIQDTGDDKKRKRVPKVDESNDILNSLAKGNFNFSTLEDKVSKIESIDPKIDETKKRKICGSAKSQIFVKNKALYETAKILMNHVENIDGEADENLSNYIQIVGEKKTVLDDCEPEQLEESSTNIRENPKREDNLENIFFHAYNFTLGCKHHWKDFVPEEELKKNFQKEEMKDDAVEDEEDEEDDDYYDQEYYEEYDEYYEAEGVSYDENGKRIYAYSDIPNRMVWMPVDPEESVLNSKNKYPTINLLENDGETEVPVEETQVHAQTYNEPNLTEPSTSHVNIGEAQAITRTRDEFTTNQSSLINNLTYSQHNHFLDCFQRVSNQLWRDGVRFDRVEDFDSWFFKWHQQVQSVRDYVRQNIYVNEMSTYQNSMRKYD